MLRIHLVDSSPSAAESAAPVSAIPSADLLRRALWIDLVRPSDDEIRSVEEALGFPLPTKETITEIEASSRVYQSDSALVMNLQLITGNEPTATTVASLILTRQQLITIHDNMSPSFRALELFCEQHPKNQSATRLLMQLLEHIIDVSADLLESAGSKVDHLSARIFQLDATLAGRLSNSQLRSILRGIGRVQFLLNKVHESLITQIRVVSYLSSNAADPQADSPYQLEPQTLDSLASLSNDLRSLHDNCSFLIESTNFLLDAIVGCISIEQNAIMTVFSVVAVIFMPPTLIATIYGMNFRHMPELTMPYGYPLAMLVMLLSAVLPFLWFKKKGWL